MTTAQQTSGIRGRTIRLIWTDGPTRGMTHEHVFHEDGTVEWRVPDAGQKSGPAEDRPKDGETRIADDIYVVSYLAASGYTLTVVLNFRDRRVVGFASSSTEWYPVEGTLE